MKIKINPYSKESVENAITQIKTYRDTIEPKVNEILSQLTALGGQIVEYQYYSPNAEYDTEVSCIVNGNSSMIIAEGLNVMFLEFGTGIYTEDNSEEMESEGLPPIFAGSYSQSEGTGQFRPDHQYWYYNRVKYAGTLPTHGFYFASKEIKKQAVEIAKKVFKK